MYIKKIIVAIALLGVVIGGFMVNHIYDSIFTPNTAFSNKKAFVYITTNASFTEVTTQLQPLLKDVSSFVEVAKRKGYASHIRPGKFAITKGMSNNDIINTLRSKRLTVKLAFNNQETLGQLSSRIASQIEADSADIHQVFLDPAFLQKNGLTKHTVLATCIPNTYEFYWNTSALQFREKMQREYQRFWNSSRKAKAKKIGLTPLQVSALAAIVHKETAKVSERPRVAGVYLNRVNKGMLLQADPTVIYAIREKANDFKKVIKRVLYKDLELDSAFNTYKYTGIPPGLIAMPDVSAIDAVLNAEKHAYLYFVADVTRFGYHKFAKTLAQHNRNKQAYVNWVNTQGIRR